MSNNKLAMAIKLATVTAALGVAGQAAAIGFNAGDATVDIYGYARLNASYDIDEDISHANGTRSGDFSKVNTGAEEDNEVSGHFGADAVQSRLGVRTTLPNDLKVTVEGDFRTSTSTVRLRHAYGQYENWILGQTWSNHTSFTGATSVLEFDGVAGNAGLYSRSAQIRYTTGGLSFSAEDSKASITDGATAVSTKQSIPTFTARYTGKAGPLAFSTSALVQQVGYDTGTEDDSAMGFAAFGSAKFSVTDAVSIQGNVNYTDGANGYLWRSGTNYYGEDAYVTANGDVETITGYSANIGASVKAGPGAFNIVYGMTTMDWDDAVDDGLAVGDKHETNTNAFVNYQWVPVENVALGVQYGYYEVEKVNGDDGNASRLMFAAQYNF
ncbi:MAG: DcaP family trimeric outer membrane transporter [Marinobacter sp.]|uniref:DcaP family trimeric outer membrane transporter n=1 Tax=Marinobacter sp. TaxID=50741 RepID=UPI00349FF424